MKNDDFYSSLSRMADEFNRLVSPLTDQLKIDDRWHEIESPVLRVAKMRDDVLPGITAFDLSLANRLRMLIDPYQSILDNMSAIETMMGTRFAELVRPQIFIPGISSGLTLLASSTSQVGQEAKMATGAKLITIQTKKTVEPWLTDLSVISAFNTVIDDSSFGRLINLEKTVAGLPSVIAHCNQMISVSAQIASLQRVSLTEAWKNAITPPELVIGLNDFALKQYEHIQKASDDQTIAWRLGLINAASRFVDSLVKWGSTLAVDSDEEAPETEMSLPNLSELPVFLSYAKRDNKDTEEAFNESQFAQITDLGKLIIHKAKAINDFCKARRKEILFPETNLLNWAMVLSGSFCRDPEALNQLLDTLCEMFIREPIIQLVGNHSCFADLRSNRGTTETKKRNITKIQKQVFWQVISIEEELLKQFDGIEATYIDEESVSSHVMKALLAIQRDKLYENVKEDNINDGIRNQLGMVYEIKDQTRQGESESGKDAGEVDIVICENGNPVVIMEGLKMDSFKKEYLNVHINKALVNYDPNGCPLVYILIYATVKGFGTLWDKIMNHMKGYCFPYTVEEEIREISVVYTDSRHAKVVLNRNGKRVSVHLCAVEMK